ncbi:MAG: 1-(5-phosphoribosyl)-5-[(5-phosphoribosylamino)methylideneamino]imidazole-4-carboxamide isomerase [Desulfohalobiaceae bacterium]
MIIFPALDIKDGECVRLKQGKEDQVTVFSRDPKAMALHWTSLGATWLHVVDLDGAFQGVPVNYQLIREICSQVKVPVQLGGGIREERAAENYFQAGVERLIVGTLALEDKQALARLCRRWPGKVGVSLDADQGRLKSKGWVEDSGRRVFELLPELEGLGVAFLVYTDISRDGMQSGVNMQTLQQVLQVTSLPVLAAGGVHQLQDIQELYPLSKQGLQGVITGRAIYTGSMDLKQALDWLASQKSG